MKLTKKIIDIIEYYDSNGIDKTVEKYGLKDSSIKRYYYLYKKNINEGVIDNEINIKSDTINKPDNLEDKKQRLFEQIKDKLSYEELKMISKSIDPSKTTTKSEINLNLDKNSVKIGVFTDSHIGSVYFKEEWWDYALKTFEDSGVDFICHVGDLTEGLSERKGHWYDLTHIGYEAQKNYAIELLNRTTIPIYGIDGNHDRWYIKSANAVICKDVERGVKHYTFLGSDEGDIHLNDNVSIKLWHGEDGSSYATSYRIQKLIESFSVGEEPDVLLCGHTHKTVFMPNERNVFAFGAGSMCSQSKWMRSKRLANHSGFWVIDINFNEEKVLSCKGEYFPLYEGKKDKKFFKK